MGKKKKNKKKDHIAPEGGMPSLDVATQAHISQKIEPGPAERLLIEEAGLTLENCGLPRMAGRLVGWLLLCQPQLQTAGDLATAVGGSKGSISTMLQLLIHRELIERQGVPGQRRAGYCLRLHAGRRLLAGALRPVSDLRLLAQRGRALRDSQSPGSGFDDLAEYSARLERHAAMLFQDISDRTTL